MQLMYVRNSIMQENCFIVVTLIVTTSAGVNFELLLHFKDIYVNAIVCIPKESFQMSLVVLTSSV